MSKCVIFETLAHGFPFWELYSLSPRNCSILKLFSVVNMFFFFAIRWCCKAAVCIFKASQFFICMNINDRDHEVAKTKWSKKLQYFVKLLY